MSTDYSLCVAENNWLIGLLIDFIGMTNHQGFLYLEVRESYSLYVYIYIFCEVVSQEFLWLTVIYQVIISNINNLRSVS